MLTGQIPLFSNIPNVIVLSLGNNRLTGTIPNFPNLKEVVSIHLHNNLLTGTIPVFSSVLVKISDLVLDSNKLTGTIPDFSSVPSLLNIQISNNSLHGNIPNFRENSKLKLFDASSNFLTGTLPSFEVCLELKMIDVSNNYLISVLQQSLPSLQTLSISNNRLEGELPDLMNPSLVSLDLSFNTLLDIDLPQWPSLKKLRVFDAYNCSSLKSKLPQGMDGYTEISDMSLSHSMMTVNISESIAMVKIGKRSQFSRNSSTSTNDESLSLGRKVLESILPATLKPTDRYELDNITDLYRCSTISVRNPSILRPQIDMPSSYYEKIFCQCLPGYFGFQGNCVKCPPDCDCPDGKTLRECYPSPSVKNISRVFPCPNPNACYYRITDDNWIDLIDQKFDFPCEEGYDGRVCSKCAENFILEGSNCNECDVEFTVSTTVVLIIIFSAGFFASVATEWFGFFDFDSAQLDIFLFYTQVIQIITAVVKISISSRVIRTISSLITFKIPSLECLQKLEPAWVLAANLLRIPLIFGVGFVVYLVARKVKPTIRVKVVSLIFVFLETSYFSVAADVLSAYGCTVYDEPLGKWYLTFHPWMQCYPFTTDYRNLLIVTIPGLLFLVGYPLLLWQIAKVAGYETYSVNNFPDKDGQIDRSGQEKGSGMEEMDEPEDGSVGDIVTFAVNMYKVHAHNGQRYASGRSADSAASGVDQGESQRGDSASNPEQVREEIPTIWKDFVVIQSMNITSIYEKRCFWWVTVRIIQSLLFGFSVNIIPYTSPGILYFTLFAWIQISIFLQNAYSPYLHDSDDLLAVVSFNVLYISFFCALLTQFLQDVEWVAYLIIGVNSLFVLYFVYTFVPAIKSKLARKKTTQVIPKELELKAIHMDEKNEKAKSKANAFEQAHQKVREYSSNSKK
eukprot:TRINITY_DN4282_c0_g2_i2.p1 TRINITY_DN4282_c0_g2~~TRINITY_DN4282_c0_g2_i2.p1  ORF type:complete len:906 (+),score=162.90 TRINITY_DN4282_c0_g2_i2:2477-5194(+)